MISLPLLHPHIHTSACAVRLLCLMYSFRLRGELPCQLISNISPTLFATYCHLFVVYLFLCNAFRLACFFIDACASFFFVTCSCALFKKNLPPAKNLFSIRIDARFQRFFCVAGVCSELGGFKLTLFAFHLMEWIVCPYHRFPPVRLYNFGSNWISNDRDRHTTHNWRLFSKHSPRGT